MSDLPKHRKKTGLATRLFKAVGQAGSAVGGVAGGILRSAGQSAKNAGGRAALRFSKEVEYTGALSLRELAESLTQWLVQEHQGKADLQQQKPSTVELSELGQVSTLYQLVLDEPGLLGRKFRFVFRQKPLIDVAANFPEPSSEKFDDQALIVISWPQTLHQEPKDAAILIWDKACMVGQRNAASDLCQAWLADFAGGTFPSKRVLPKRKTKASKSLPLFGREQAIEQAKSLLLAPRARGDEDISLISLAAPGGTGKSFYLKALRAEVGHRVVWAGVDHQGMAQDKSGADFLGRILSQLAQGLEEQSVDMSGFAKELRAFRRELDQAKSEATGFFGHLKKAADKAAGINPILGAVSAGVTFLTSWGQEAKEESEALAKDNAVKSLTNAFKADLTSYAKVASAASLCWARPVLVFDTYEWLAALIDTWVRTEFLSGDFLSETRAIVILSGRENLLRTDTRWSEWQHRVRNISLECFDRATAKAYLQSLSIDESRFESLYELTEGLPLFLSLASHIEEIDQAVGILAQRVLEEVALEHREDFLKASLLPSLELQSVASLFPQKTSEDLAALLRLLSSASFSVAKDGKRSFLPPVRRILQKALLIELGEAEVSELQSRISDKRME